MSKSLRGKTVIISGASRGIGRAIAKELAVQGANISFNFLQNEQGADDLVGELNELGASVKAFKADIRDYEAVKAWVDETKNIYGALDIVINNAGIASMNHSLLTPISTARKILDTNVIGTFLFSREAVKLMKKNKWINRP